MDPVEYWRSRAMESSQEYEQLLQSQRDEIESLQRRCNDLLHERSMMKAATAADVRNFCLNYQADQQRRKGLTSSSAVEDIPVHTLMQFLHTYSNGLLPAPENVRKRYRGRDEVATTSTAAAAAAGSAASSSATPAPTVSPHRLYQRMLARQRATGRLEEYQEEHAALLEAQRLKQQQYKMEQQQHLDPQCGSSSGGLDVSAADAQPLQQQQQQPQQRHTVESQEEEDARRAAARSSRGGGGGGGGPVVSASAPDYL